MSLNNVYQDNLEAAQVKDFMLSYNKLTEFCFAQCINNLSTRKILNEEDKCINYCFGKSIKVRARIGLRIQEYQQTHLSHI